MTRNELKMVNDIFTGNGDKYEVKPYNLFTLRTIHGDVWEFDTLEEARKNLYIFGGTITKGFKEERQA